MKMNQQAEVLFNTGIQFENEYNFEKAKRTYAEILQHIKDEPLLEKVRWRMEDMDGLIAEKTIYQRIEENGKRVLTDIGMNIAENQTLMDILMEADAIDFDNETAIFIPLKRDYIDSCLEQVPRQMPGDPGLNTFGTGATPPFLKRATDDELRAASHDEYERITQIVGEQQDVVSIFSLPVANDKSISLFEVAQLMEKRFPGLKMTATNRMSDDEVTFLKGKDHWVDGTSLITSLAPMGTMVEPFLRSARTGNNLLLLDLTIAGMSGGGSPESLLTQIHAQVMFMMVMAQTVNPGVSCIHGGIPGVTEMGGDLSYSSPHQPLINAAMARVNTWITGFPSAQSGGSTSLTDVTLQAVSESELSRNSLRKYGVHIVRHALGALGSLNFFSLEKFLEDCERERRSKQIFTESPKDRGVIPMYFPADDQALAGIREIAEKGNPKSADHTLKNVDSFRLWESTINAAAKKKLYYPQLNDTVIEIVGRGEMIP
ncbi:trimethylamine methyltransferase family protein [Desulfosarcina sp.]|uniref:trimethylamine methyltransferase family protein n=1 Tax=Desulfosarcina sp. TaxID=2027861 RepID=UPI0029A9A659|nr:trimethylamine methyltransferase family protein [Desulfosarcina sp.]MDX2455350.1 trimethylamine methyltransferase family protein [Desulfosarcina sp.]MDX2492873.1 trimethylamine methyltransferase family protein [Desulfosarcina sp.]